MKFLLLYFVIAFGLFNSARSNEIAEFSSDMAKDFIPKVTKGSLEKVYRGEVNSTVEHIYIYKFTEFPDQSVRVQVEVDDTATVSSPITVFVRQESRSFTWELPSLYSNGTIRMDRNESKVLCENDVGFTDSIRNRSVVVTISTSSLESVGFSLNVSMRNNSTLKINQPYNFSIAPFASEFVQFSFEGIESDYVLLEVSSNDTSCMTVSMQNASCPIADEENQISSGYWQTMSTSAGMALRKKDFPNGFYIVLIMHVDNSRCDASNIPPWPFGLRGNELRTKNVTVVITEKITRFQLQLAIFGTLGLFAIIYVAALIIAFVHNRIYRNWGGLTARDKDICRINSNLDSDPSGQDVSDRLPILEESATHSEIRSSSNSVSPQSSQTCLSPLAGENQELFAKNWHFFFTLLAVALYYVPPVIQLVLFYQQVLHKTGNQDICYYNYLCSHPYGILSDFNHVFSNVGYILLGALFLILVLLKRHSKNVQQELEYGVPSHFGLMFAMGFALIMEGLLSACYHICPNYSNFQFDTCFMYTTAILCMVKLYQARHPEISASVAAVCLAIIVLIVFLARYSKYLIFWLLFSLVHIAFIFFVSLQLYKKQGIVETWRNDRMPNPSRNARLPPPFYKNRFWLLLLGNLVNWGIAAYGLWERPPDFATHLLAILVTNLGFYLLNYVFMKYWNGERIVNLALFFLFLAGIFWGFSFFFFLHSASSWQESPAQSRAHNRECMLLHFYDTHDIWHFLSAFAMFFTFMFLLYLDDDQESVLRTEIVKF